MVKIAVDMLRQGMIDEKQRFSVLILSVWIIASPCIRQKALKEAKLISKDWLHLRATSGRVVFNADDNAAEIGHNMAKKVIMVRVETSPEDLAGMAAAQGILATRWQL